MKMQKTLMAAAVLMAMGAGAAQAAVTNLTFTGSFLMYDGSDPANSAQFSNFGGPTQAYVGPLGSGAYSLGGEVDNSGDGNFTPGLGDPISGTMAIDFATGAGTATMTGTPFFGSSWAATNVTFTGVGPGLEHANMLFHWGDPASTSCGLTNCDIVVDVEFAMAPTANPGEFSFSTTSSWMLAGPFPGFQPTFSGTAQVVPIPAAVWLLGSGLVGLVGVARRKTQANA